MLKTILARCPTHPDEPPAIFFKGMTPSEVSQDLRAQLEGYWRGSWPFNRPLKDGDSLRWWIELKEHENARVLAVRGLLLFPEYDANCYLYC
jgi:hypothetical protein